MVGWIEPEYSRSRVNGAGDRVRSGNYDEEDLAVIENWRASHAYILNTFQVNIRNKSKGFDVTVAQRLKRRSTIFDKLQRNMGMNLARMHDVAGCRLIFQNEDALVAFRERFHESRFSHVNRNGNNDKYDYIKYPKPSGYRGVHDVYEYHVNSLRGMTWNGLLVEIQYRTIFQHAWATAVEVADLITTKRIKFSQADRDHEEFFRLTSEIIARAFEARHSCCVNLSNIELINAFVAIDRKLGLMEVLRRLRQSSSAQRFTKNMVLIFRGPELVVTEDGKFDVTEDKLDVETFDSVNRAIERYEQLERSNKQGADIVLVRADVPENIRDAFRNYFSDANEFVRFVDEGVRTLRRKPSYRPSV